MQHADVVLRANDFVDVTICDWMWGCKLLFVIDDHAITQDTIYGNGCMCAIPLIVVGTWYLPTLPLPRVVNTKVYMEFYVASYESRFTFTWIIFKKSLLGGRPNTEITALRTLTTNFFVCFLFVFFPIRSCVRMCEHE
jgi:hypothetical protein